MSSLATVAAVSPPLETLLNQVQRFVEERVLVNGPVELSTPYKVAFFALQRGQIVLCQTEEIPADPSVDNLAYVKQFYGRTAAHLSRELSAQGADKDTAVTVSAVFFKQLSEGLVTMRAMKAVCSASTHMKHTATYLPNVSTAIARQNLDAYFENYAPNHTSYDGISRFFFASQSK